MKITTRYILKEITPNYLIGLGFLSVLFFVVQVFQMVRLVVEKNVPIDKVLALLAYYLPLNFQFTIPIAVIVGTLLAIGRLSSDSEIIAMRACGISLLRIFFPTIWFGVIMTIIALLFYQFVLPVAATRYAEAKLQIYQINPTAELSRRLFYNTIDSIKITVDAVNTTTNELINVRINYANENKLIFARRGLLLSKDYEKNAFPLILFNATMQPGNIKRTPNKRFNEQFNIKQTIYIPDRPSNEIIPAGKELWSLTQFWDNLKQHDLRFAIQNLRGYNKLRKLDIVYSEKKKAFKTYLKNLKTPQNAVEVKRIKNQKLEKKIEMKKAQILAKTTKRGIDRRNSSEGRIGILDEEYAFQRRLAFSFSALAFALLGAPLGIFSNRAGKSLGLGVSIIIIVLFAGMVFLGNFLMRKELMTPIIAAWYGDWVLYVIGIILMIRRLRGI